MQWVKYLTSALGRNFKFVIIYALFSAKTVLPKFQSSQTNGFFQVCCTAPSTCSCETGLGMAQRTSPCSQSSSMTINKGICCVTSSALQPYVYNIELSGKMAQK